LRLNLSKSGVSFSLGKPGASLNLNSKGTRGSVGLPGTGLSYRKTLGSAKSGSSRLLWKLLVCAALLALGVCAFFSFREYF
jgi:hypothetical protein